MIEALTRVAAVGNASIRFEGILRHAAAGSRLAESVCVLVRLDGVTDRPVPVPGRFRGRFAEFEGSNAGVRPHPSP